MRRSTRFWISVLLVGWGISAYFSPFMAFATKCLLVIFAAIYLFVCIVDSYHDEFERIMANKYNFFLGINQWIDKDKVIKD